MTLVIILVKDSCPAQSTLVMTVKWLKGILKLTRLKKTSNTKNILKCLNLKIALKLKIENFTWYHYSKTKHRKERRPKCFSVSLYRFPHMKVTWTEDLLKQSRNALQQTTSRFWSLIPEVNFGINDGCCCFCMLTVLFKPEVQRDSKQITGHCEMLLLQIRRIHMRLETLLKN